VKILIIYQSKLPIYKMAVYLFCSLQAIILPQKLVCSKKSGGRPPK